MHADGVSKMSSVCGIRQLESQARAYYVTQFTLQVIKVHLFKLFTSQVSYVHSPRTTLFRKPKRFCSLCQLRIPIKN